MGNSTYLQRKSEYYVDVNMEWISHEDRTLREHLSGLRQIVEKVLPEKEQSFFTDTELKKLVLALIAYHDLAKVSIYFQLYLSYSLIKAEKRHKYYSKEELKNFIEQHSNEFEKWKKEPELKNHSLFGGWMSLFFWDNNIEYSQRAFLFLSILKAHHGHLKNFKVETLSPENRKGQLIEISKTINLVQYKGLMKELSLPFHYGNMENCLNSIRLRKLNKLIEVSKGNQDSRNYFQILFLYSLLLSADKGDMMLQDKNLERKFLKSSIIDDFKKKLSFKKGTINELREEAYQTAVSRVNHFGDKNFFSITLPTGLGKTFTAYKIALKIKEQFALQHRIVYCLPFTSIIDQNATIFKNILINSGIEANKIGIHHHLAIPKTEKDEETESAFYPQWEYMTEGWQNEITITTFVQLWESIFACHNRQLRKFHNLANSILILDEVQAINPKLYPALEFALMSLANYFNTKIVFVTATQPILLSERVKELCFKNKPDYFFKKINRTLLNTVLLQKEDPLSEEDLAQIILNDYEENNKSILVVCNTIRFSQKLAKVLSSVVKDDMLYYLSASLIPFTREEKLGKEIRIKLDKNKPIILVSTQVVEAGVDIDFDTVYRDFAPLSSINQAAGRCNRNSKKGISKVFLFRSGKERIYDPTQLDITKRVLNSFGDEISENQFYNLNRKYFKEVKQKIQDDSNISTQLIKDIQNLQFENVGRKSEYRLFVEKYKTYNYFIPINETAEEIWEEYLIKTKIEDNFKRRQALKLLRPKLMNYVVKIPDYVISPIEEDKEKAIINLEDWEVFYDKDYGYKLPEKENPVEIF